MEHIKFVLKEYVILKFTLIKFKKLLAEKELHGGAVGLGTVLQAGRSRVRFSMV
jgi:hypothetical protein